MDRSLAIARALVGGALCCLGPTVIFAGSSRPAAALAVAEAAVLAIATAWAFYVGVYRFPR